MIPHVNDYRNEKDTEEIDLSNLYQYEKQKHLNWYDQILLNRPLKVVIAYLLLGILAPVLIYHFLFYSTLEPTPSDGLSVGSCIVPRASRLPCGFGDVSQAECHPQCCYDLNSNVCFHRYPSRFSYVDLVDRPWTENITLQPRISTVPFGSQNSIPSLKLSIDEVSPTHMSLQFYNPRDNSFSGRRIDEKNYTHAVTRREMSVTVEGPQGLIFSTIRGPLIAAENIWEIAFKLTNDTMYGLGELPLREGTVKVIYNHRGGLSGIPLIYAKIDTFYHGVLIEAEAPTEIMILEENHVVVRSITNSGLKLHIFVGPKPSDVMNDAMELLEANKQLEYWMLGAHICSQSAKTSEEALAELQEFMTTASRELPFESHCGAKPIVFHSDCTLEKGTYHEDGASAVKAAGKRYVPQISPYIRYEAEDETSSEEVNETEEIEETEQSKAYEYINDNATCTEIVPKYEKYMLRTATEDLYVGSIQNVTFIYPIFENASAEFMKKLWPYEMKLDGVVLENSWPLDESPKSNETSSFLPYFSKNIELAFENTPELNTKLFNETLYFYTHNQYGNHFTAAFKTLLDEDTPVWATSQWMNGEVKINRQNIDTSWTHLRRELVEAALGGVSGHWSWSTPICGDTDAFDPESQTSLCVKWYMAATYMPLIKIHSTATPRHPLAFTGTNKNLMITALNRRLSLLPYFYSTLQTGPLLRPMFYQFPESEHLKDLSTQFSVGEDLVIVPNLQPSQSHVHFWVPPGTWYEIWSGLKVDGEEGDVVTMTSTESDFLTLIRGGSILPMQKDVKTTAEETRLHSDFSLTIALDCDLSNHTEHSDNASVCAAEGNIFIADDISLAFKANSKQLTIYPEGDDFAMMCEEDNAIVASKIKDIRVYGLDNEHNNYDHHRQIQAGINLCELKDSEEHKIVFLLLS